MSDCVCLPKCPFFNDKMANMPGTAAIIKRNYCQGDNSNCARFLVFQALGREAVPADMYPNQVALAREIIAKGKK